MPMTSDAKQALKETVRSLRTRLLADLHDATEGFAFLLRLVYAGLAMELPGLYGD